MAAAAATTDGREVSSDGVGRPERAAPPAAAAAAAISRSVGSVTTDPAAAAAAAAPAPDDGFTADDCSIATDESTPWPVSRKL